MKAQAIRHTVSALVSRFGCCGLFARLAACLVAAVAACLAPTLAPRVLELSGADGHKGVTGFDARGKPLATAHDFGDRNNAIVGSGVSRSSMLFPAVQAADTPICLRVERLRYTVVVAAVELTANAVQGDREMWLGAHGRLPDQAAPRGAADRGAGRCAATKELCT